MRDSTGGTRRARGQTTIDFGIGVSIFLVTIVFVFLFIPSLFTPFVSDQSHVVTSDRAADQLVEDTLLPVDASASRYVLDRECTVAFFETMEAGGESSYADNCRYDDEEMAEMSLQEILGVDAERGVQVTIEPSAGIAGEEANPHTPIHIRELITNGEERRSIDGIERLRAGQDTPVRGNVVAAQRMVLITADDGTSETYRLFVRIW